MRRSRRLINQSKNIDGISEEEYSNLEENKLQGTKKKVKTTQFDKNTSNHTKCLTEQLLEAGCGLQAIKMDTLKNQSVDIEALDKFVGYRIHPEPGDNQMKAATVRFLLAGTNNREVQNWMQHDLNSNQVLNSQLGLLIKPEYMQTISRTFNCFAKHMFFKDILDKAHLGSSADLDGLLLNKIMFYSLNHKLFPEVSYLLNQQKDDIRHISKDDTENLDFIYVSPPLDSKVWPTFNRMSGILEFKNTIVLYVNIGCDHYQNEFKIMSQQFFKSIDVVHNTNVNVQEQRKFAMTFYAQPKQTSDSRIVQRMITSGMSQPVDISVCVSNQQDYIMNNVAKQSPSILNSLKSLGICKNTVLFCRLNNGSFHYCGKLNVLDIDLTVSPIKFTYEFLDLEKLLASKSMRHLLNQL